MREIKRPFSAQKNTPSSCGGGGVIKEITVLVSRVIYAMQVFAPSAEATGWGEPASYPF